MIAADYSTHPAHAVLRPRAVALLCALRRKPLSPAQLSISIGDDSTNETKALIAAMDGSTRGTVAYLRAVVRGAGVELTDDGVAWLGTHGLAVARRDPPAQAPATVDADPLCGYSPEDIVIGPAGQTLADVAR